MQLVMLSYVALFFLFAYVRLHMFDFLGGQKLQGFCPVEQTMRLKTFGTQS